MKKAFGLLLIILLSAGFASAQEKKEKQQIKIVIADKDGEKIVIDTTFKTTSGVDTIRLGDGKVVVFDNEDKLTTAHVSSGEAGKVVIISSQQSENDNDGNVMAWVSSDEDANGRSVVYVHKSNNGVKDGEVRYNVEVTSDGSGDKSEKSSYVVAKDGMVVTIEGGDEEKVKELAAVIEAKLGVNKDGKNGKQEVKTETKKTTKK